MNSLGVYVHVPFCAGKCPYCDFYSRPYRKADAAAYVRAAAQDMSRFRDDRFPADTLYFGGGTPSLLPPELLGELIAAVRESFRLAPKAEITLEANPNTVSPARARLWAAMGINRLSCGLQSAESGELQALGRRHTPEQAALAVQAALDAGISNISLDVMLGVPGQTAESLRRTLEFACALPLTHLSAYLLKPEPDTPYWDSPLLRECPEEEELAGLYLRTAAFLEEAGFRHYEISNFARPGFESRHNRKYWLCQEYLGFGPGAHSFFAGKRYGYARSLEEYISAPGARPIVTDAEAGGLEERILLGLRLREGIPLSLLEPLEPEARAAFLRKARRLESGGLARLSERLSLTPEGFLVSNTILADLLAVLPEDVGTLANPSCDL